MSRQIRLTRADEPQDEGMTMEQIIAQLKSIRNNAILSLNGDKEFDAIWEADVRACDAVTDILTALRDEGINTPDEVRELLASCRAVCRKFEEVRVKEVPQWCVFIRGRLAAACGNHARSRYDAVKARQSFIHSGRCTGDEAVVKIAWAPED